MLQLLEPFRYLWNALTSERSPRQIAWGIALGVWLGMIPKGNLTAWLVGVILLATRANLGFGMLAAMAATALSPVIDPLTHGLGLRLLDNEFIRSFLVRWHNVPLVPWLRLNNTVVVGSVSLGLVLLYPIQHLSELVAVKLAPWFARRFGRHPAHVQAEASPPQTPATGPQPSPETEELPATVQAALRQIASTGKDAPQIGQPGPSPS